MTATAQQTAQVPVLEINGLTQRFGGLMAISDFNVSLDQRELVGLIGPNGAGKTTIFNLVSGFYQPSEGKIFIDGKPTAGLKPHKVTALGVARTFQNIRLWNEMSVLDNIRVAQHGKLGYGFFHAIARSRTYQARRPRLSKRPMHYLKYSNSTSTPMSCLAISPTDCSAKLRLSVPSRKSPNCCFWMNQLPAQLD